MLKYQSDTHVNRQLRLKLNQSHTKSSEIENRLKHVNCTAIQGILIYFRKQYGQDYLITFLDEINLPYRRLSDKSEWISFDEYKKLLNAFANHADNPNIIYEMGKYSCSREALGGMWSMFLADFVGLKSAIRKVVENANLFNRVSDWEIVKLTHNKFHLRVHWKEGNLPTPHLCRYRQGLFSYLPSMWNGEPAKYSELKCTAKGDEYCEEVYTWKSKPRHIFLITLPLITATAITTYGLVFDYFHPLFSLYLIIALLMGKIVDDKRLNQHRESYTFQQQAELRRTIGELEKKQDELLATNEMANYAYEELSEGKKTASVKLIAASTAHNLNNLLVGITGYIDMARDILKSNNQYSDVASYLYEAANALKKSEKLTNQFLHLSQDNAIATKPTVINDCLHESIKLALVGSAIECHYDIADEITPVNVDKELLSQVFSNLAINASQAMPQGGHLYVSVKNIQIDNNSPEFERSIAEGCYLLIRFCDEGAGMSPNHQKVIFDPYFTTKKNGTGLGLTSSLHIIQKHNGYLFVQSQEGEGSCIHIYLPASKEDAIDDNKVEDIPIFNHGHILILDDDTAVKKVLKGMLTYLGYEVSVAQDGNQAFTLYVESMHKKRPFDAIIIDLILPSTVGGGRAVIKSIQDIDPHVKAIATSGYLYKNALDHHLEHGFLAAIRKPYNLAYLSQVLFDVIHNDQEEDTNGAPSLSKKE